jgi:hypothetical protein
MHRLRGSLVYKLLSIVPHDKKGADELYVCARATRECKTKDSKQLHQINIKIKEMLNEALISLSVEL